MLFQRPPSHEQTQVIARRDLVADVFRLRSHQPFHCKQLFRSNHLVGIAGKKIYWNPQTREVDPLPEGDEASGSQFVALV